MKWHDLPQTTRGRNQKPWIGEGTAPSYLNGMNTIATVWKQQHLCCNETVTLCVHPSSCPSLPLHVSVLSSFLFFLLFVFFFSLSLSLSLSISESLWLSISIYLCVCLSLCLSLLPCLPKKSGQISNFTCQPKPAKNALNPQKIQCSSKVTKK